MTRAIALGAALLLAACGAPQRAAPSYDEAAAKLAACPRGDRAWRDAIAAATAAGKLGDLATLSAELARRCADRWEPAWCAGECRFRSNPPDSRADYDEALRRARAERDRVGIACAANRLGALAYRAGDLASGETLYREALASAEREEREDLSAFVRNNLAGLLLEKGEYALARDELERAADGFEKLGMREAARAAAFNRAVIFAELGDAVAARDALEAVYRDAREARDDATLHEAAITLAKLHLATDGIPEAEEWFGRARGGAADIDALADLGLGRAALVRGDLPAAERLLQAASSKARAQERLFELIALTRLAEAEMLAGRIAQASQRLLEVIARSDEKNAAESAWAARSTLGRLRMREGRWGDAVHLLEAAIGILEAQHERLDPLGEGLYFLRERAGPYVDLAVAVTRSLDGPARAARVLEIATRAKARALRRALRSDSEGADVSTAGTIPSIRQGLGEADVVLDYLIGEEHGVVLALTRRDAHVEILPGRRELAPLLAVYLASLRPGAPGTEAEAGSRLRRALLDPVADLVAAAERLYVVPDRELALLPFAALPLDGQGFVGDRLEVATLPLSGAPPRWDGEKVGARDARTPVLLAGQPRQTGDAAKEFPPLPWASFELSNVRAIWGEASTTLLTGAGFRVDTLVDALAKPEGTGYRTVHLASHAVASTSDPRRCGVIASDGERLGITDVARRLRLAPSSLVILSACRTGIGEIVPGEGVIGLGWSFLRAGASGVVASHWTVDDASSARIMVAFHRRLADGDDPVRALSLASREIRKASPEYAHPRHWAPFVIVLRPEGVRSRRSS